MSIDPYLRNYVNADWHSMPNNWQGAQVALLMDIRSELRKLNGLLHCKNFIQIPGKLDRIGRNTAKPKRKRKSVAKKKAVKK